MLDRGPAGSRLVWHRASGRDVRCGWAAVSRFALSSFLRARNPEPQIRFWSCQEGRGRALWISLLSLAQRADAFRDRRELVLIEQRGTGQSSGLHCEPPASAVDLMGPAFRSRASRGLPRPVVAARRSDPIHDDAGRRRLRSHPRVAAVPPGERLGNLVRDPSRARDCPPVSAPRPDVVTRKRGADDVHVASVRRP